MKKVLLLTMMAIAMFNFAKAQSIVIDFENDDYVLGACCGAEVARVENPDKSGINKSDTVLQFKRWAGDPWALGVIEVPDSIDVTVTKYAHMKVWKPRISAVKLKIEAGG
ncbi:MAG: hypothetical protein PF517_14025, partial [Salinivirgaceae bacterium]|nr:hypothetical protein [Salinivirgaceae bacterium]